MFFRRIIAAAMTAGIMLSLAPFTVLADSSGWQGSDENGWRYFTSDEEYIKDSWKYINGNWYYFNDIGLALTDVWAYIEGKLYHFDKNGHMERNKWISCGEIKIPEGRELYANERIVLNPEYQGKHNWRYVGDDGAAYIGWKNINGSWYHFSDDKSWYNDIRMGRYGQIDYGWFTDKDGSNYCFDSNGKMMTNTWYDQGDGVWFYFGSDGRAYEGWHKLGGKWYWFNKWYDNDSYDLNIARGVTDVYEGNGVYGTCVFSDDGELLYGWQQVNGKWYYSAANGFAYRSKWFDYCGKKYYFNSQGVMVASEKEYYIDGKLYNFDSNGACSNYSSAQKIEGWYQVKGNAVPGYIEDGLEYWVYVDKNGNQYRDKWLNYNGSWYYFYPEGFMASGIDFVYYNGKIYTFDEKGKCLNFDQNITGWYSVKVSEDYTAWFYYGSDGKVLTGWQNINNKWYYFGKYSGTLTQNGLFSFENDDRMFFFDKNGVLQTGWCYEEDSDSWFYADADGQIFKDGWKNVDGKWYYFDDISMVTDCKYLEIKGKYYDFDKDGVCLNPDSGRPLEVIIIEQ
ncbi:MAG: hypothetical protein K5665_04155 [Saccharofermentans sp.]|nr:hypothetical protein [Saccharofermentans sp.]